VAFLKISILKGSIMCFSSNIHSIVTYDYITVFLSFISTFAVTLIHFAACAYLIFQGNGSSAELNNSIIVCGLQFQFEGLPKCLLFLLAIYRVHM
jgi:hypothetical protein